MKNLETKRYLLRKPKIEDAEEIYERWGTDKEKMAEYKAHNAYKNLIEIKALITAAIKETEYGTPFWIIEEKKSNKIVGYVKLPISSEKNKKCEVTFYFLDGWRDDGTLEEVLGRIINYIFSEGEFETIVMKFYGRNKKDIEILDRVLTTIGMKREGILRNRLINSEGKKIDKYIYSILKEEY